jgi:uncharacterized Fe-S center protein
MFREKGDNDTRVLQMAWTESRDEQTLKMVELTKGVLEKVGKDKFIFVNVALDVAQHCDCVNIASPHLVGDQGIFVSKDILAVDKACYDQVKAAEGLPLLTGKPIPAGEDKFTLAHPKVDPETKEKTPTFHHLLQFKHGKKMNLGTTEYSIKQVDRGC